MKIKKILLFIIVIGLLSSCVFGEQLVLPSAITTNSPAVGNTSAAAISGSVPDYGDLKTTEVASTPDSKTPVIRYANDNIPEGINNLIDHIDFQTSKNKTAQTYIYFKLPSPDASVNQSKKLAEYILSRNEWIGDRSVDSVTAEIYIHWVADNALPLVTTNPVNEALYEQYIIGEGSKRPSPVSPTHLRYNYAGLDKKNLIDQFLLTL